MIIPWDPNIGKVEAEVLMAEMRRADEKRRKMREGSIEGECTDITDQKRITHANS